MSGGAISSQFRERPFRRLTTLQTVLVAAVVAAIGAGLLYAGGRADWWSNRPSLQALINNLGGALIVSVALGALWELFGKRTFAREILETARTSTDVEAAGLTRIGSRYLDDPDWEHLFRTVRKLDISVAYARTWRHSNVSRLQAVAARPDARIRLYLPDPSDPKTVNLLADRFNQTPDELVAAIMEAQREFEALRRPRGAEITVHHRRGDLLFSWYRFDGTAVLTLYSHSGERVSAVPTLVFTEGGSLYQYVRDELYAIDQQSQPAASASPDQGATP